MINGIGKWQVRASAVGLIGLVIAVVGSGVAVPFLTALGFALFGAVVLSVIIMSAKRTNLRTKQIKSALARLESRPAIPTTQPPIPGLALPADHVHNTKSVQDINTEAITMGSEFEYARRMRSVQSHLETFALRSRSTNIRNSFSRCATGGILRYSDLIRVLAVIDLGSASEHALAEARRWRPEPLLALARIAVNQRTTESDLEDAIRIFAFVERHFGTKALGRTDRFLFLEALNELGAHKALRKTSTRFRTDKNYPVQGALLSLNAIGLATPQKEDSWVSSLNRLYEASSLVGVSMAPNDNLPIDRLRTVSGPIVTDGPLVSVILPTHNGSELIATAIASLVSQTWQNLEIIIVDDCSEESHFARLRELSAADPKITLLRQPRNLGAYCARNLGLGVARGEFVTVHDDDDWSHAQKIELQVRHLLNNPEVPANLSLHARCTAELEFLRINNNPQFAQANFSSLMVRRPILTELGGWDSVNRGADAEFRDRLVAFSGQTIPEVGDVPLSFTRTRSGSLTSGEMIRGYVDSARLLYLASYQQWHRTVAGTDQLTLKGALERPFPVPKNMEPGLRGQHLGAFDVVFATDFRFPGGTSSLTLSEIRTAAHAGLRVGVIQLDSPLNKFSAPLASGLFESLSLPGVEALSLTDHADVALFVVRHPSVVTFVEGLSSKLSVQHCVMVVNNPPVLLGGEGMVFDLPTCIENLDRLFGVRSEVVAESGLTRKLCSGLVTRSRLSKETWPGVVALESMDAEVPQGATPVLGRHSRDHELKWPTSLIDFNAAYKSPDGHFKTVILGGADALAKKFGQDASAGITVHPYGTVNVADFLSNIHFWAYFHDDRLTESFGMAAAEAMAAGKVVFLPEYMKATFGEGAVYCSPSDIQGLISKYTADKRLYAEQSARARRIVAENFSADALIRRIFLFSGSEPAEEVAGIPVHS